MSTVQDIKRGQKSKTLIKTDMYLLWKSLHRVHCVIHKCTLKTRRNLKRSHVIQKRPGLLWRKTVMEFKFLFENLA